MPHDSKRFFLLLTYVFIATTCASPALSQPDSEWVLQQYVDKQGNFSVYLSHDAVKIVNLDWGYQLVAKAPTWKLHCFRPKEKVDWISDIKQFNGGMLINPNGYYEPSSAHMMPLEHGVMQGLNYTNHAASRGSQSKLYTADEIVLSAPVLDLLCRFYNLPNSAKAPPIYSVDYRNPSASRSYDASAGWTGRFEFTADKRTGKVVQLETKSWKKQPFKSQDFEYPLGFSVVPKISLVAYSTSQRESMNEAFNALGFTSDVDERKKTKTGGPKH